MRRDMGHQIVRRCVVEPFNSCTKATTSSLPSTARPTTAHCTTASMGIEHRLDLGRIDVEAGADDHLLGAADDEEAIALEAREIAGVEPAVGIDRLRGEIGRAVIAAHHVAAADMKLADLAVADRLPSMVRTIRASMPGSKLPTA